MESASRSLDETTDNVKKRNKQQQPGLSLAGLMNEWLTWWTAKAPVLLFAAKFGGLIVLLYVLLATQPVDRMLYGYLKANAWLSNGILNLLGQGTHVSDVTIASTSTPFAIAIKRGCDAVEPTWLLCAAIVAFPGSWKHKFVGMAAGIIALQLLNLVRIVTLYWIGSRFPSIFPSMHLEVWPTLFILAASDCLSVGKDGPMANKLTRRVALGFLLRFAVVFGLLIAPWPGWNKAYSQFFQAFGGMVFSGDGPREVKFAPYTDGKSPLDTQVTLINRALTDNTGHAQGRQTELDTRSIGWVPTALTTALVVATPIAWPRRLTALAGALVLIHLFILFTLQAWIWDNSADLSLVTLSDFARRVVGELDYALVTQLGASFTVPVLIWVLVTFRRQDELAN